MDRPPCRVANAIPDVHAPVHDRAEVERDDPQACPLRSVRGGERDHESGRREAGVVVAEQQYGVQHDQCEFEVAELMQRIRQRAGNPLLPAEATGCTGPRSSSHADRVPDEPSEVLGHRRHLDAGRRHRERDDPTRETGRRECHERQSARRLRVGGLLAVAIRSDAYGCSARRSSRALGAARRSPPARPAHSEVARATVQPAATAAARGRLARAARAAHPDSDPAIVPATTTERRAEATD